MGEIAHALVLNLHQPSWNLESLLSTNPWEVKEILWAMDRMPRACWPYEDVARVHLSLSGSLLETLSHPDFQAAVYGTADCGSLLWALQNQRIFDILGTGYYHPVMPLIPDADWDAQMERWRGIAGHLFWRQHFSGFWPPEMGFRMEMIPHLVRMGYRYVLVDSEYVEPLESMRWEEIRYRPHIAEHDGAEIIVIVRDRSLSDAQLAGMDPGWFLYEVHERTTWCDFTPLVVTATDGDNGGWFRNTNEKANFWHYFYQPLLDKVRLGEAGLRPTFIDEYLDRHGPHGRVIVHTGAWNTDEHHGRDFLQWTGSQDQQDAWARLHRISKHFHAVAAGNTDPGRGAVFEAAYWRILRAETSCNFYWGESWVHRTHQDLDDACMLLSGLGVPCP